MTIRISNPELKTVLNWYRALGIEILFYPVPRVPQEQKNESHSKHVKCQCTEARNILTNVSVSTDCSDIDEFIALCNEIKKIDCPLSRTARNTVIYEGNVNAQVMLIGEAPGYDEDIQGKPFVGRSGVLLNKMLASINLKREDVFITNTVFWRPPGNRNPAPDEISICLPFVNRLIKLVSPSVILLLGSIATHAILDTTQPISKLRGQVTDFMGICTIPTYHPAYLLRNPNQKRAVYNDLLLLDRILNRNR